MFNVADVVVLKSSPDVLMTIEIIKDQIAHCKWLDKTGAPQHGPFLFAVLERVTSPQTKTE